MRNDLGKCWRFLSVLVALVGAAVPVSASAAPARVPYGNILFIGTRNSNADVYVQSPTSTTAKRIVSNPGHDCGPAMRPGGPGTKQLVFSSLRDDGSIDPGGHFQLYSLDLSTHKLKALTNTPGQHNLGPTWSPDGKQIAFASTRNASIGTPNWPIADGTIWVMNADGSHLRQLTDIDDTHSQSFPAWSPDGKWIAFMSTSKLDPARPSVFAVRPNGEGMHVLQYDALYPSWSPDSKQIAFSSGRAGLPHDQDLYTMNADGSDPRKLTHLSGAEYMPSWSPDGKHMLYVHDPDGWTDIGALILLPSGGTAEAFTTGPQRSSIWEVDLTSAHGTLTATNAYQRTLGGNDFFPRFAPAWLH